jgi:ABC-type sugar transport system ATPase subunit
LADRILVMREGRIVHEFATGAATQEALLDAALGHEATPSRS